MLLEFDYVYLTKKSSKNQKTIHTAQTWKKGLTWMDYSEIIANTLD